MSQRVINIIRRKKYLTEEQLDAAIKESAAFMKYFRSRDEQDRKQYHEARDHFLTLTEGKYFCQLVPLSVW
jgi:hypothetical protein